jgi:hypothetical protein
MPALALILLAALSRPQPTRVERGRSVASSF